MADIPLLRSYTKKRDARATNISPLTGLFRHALSYNLLIMTSLEEIEAAAEALPPEQKEELFQFLAARLRASEAQTRKARLVRDDDDVLLEAPPDAPPMTAKNVKRMLEDWP